MLKFKFFEGDNLSHLETELNAFTARNYKEITKDSIVKVYYNRTYIPKPHPTEKIVNSIILVWDNEQFEEDNQIINSVKEYEDKVKEKPVILSDEETQKQHALEIIEKILSKEGVRETISREFLFDIVKSIEPHVSSPWLKYIIANELEEYKYKV